MSNYIRSTVFRDEMRRHAGDTTATPKNLRHIADDLDKASLSGNILTHFADAQMLRNLADEIERGDKQNAEALQKALDEAGKAHTAYRRLLDDYGKMRDLIADSEGENAELQGTIHRQADIITEEARRIEVLTRDLSRERKHNDAMSRVIVRIIDEMDKDGDDGADLVFVYGTDNDGVDPEVASDLGVGCVLGKGSR